MSVRGASVNKGVAFRDPWMKGDVAEVNGKDCFLPAAIVHNEVVGRMPVPVRGEEIKSKYAAQLSSTVSNSSAEQFRSPGGIGDRRHISTSTNKQPPGMVNQEIGLQHGKANNTRN